VLPYHTFGGAKAEFAGMPDDSREDWIPDEETVRRAKELLEK
jgi:hypothetical protein